MAGRQSLQDVAHKLNRKLILSVGGQPPPVIAGYLRWKSLLEARFFSTSALSLCIKHNTQQSTPSQLKAAHVQSAPDVFSIYLCFTCLLDALRGSPQVLGGSFNFDQLLFLHLEPHNNWPQCWTNMLASMYHRHRQCVCLTPRWL